MKRGLNLPLAPPVPNRPPLRPRRGQWRGIVLALALVSQLLGCEELYERPSDAVGAGDTLVRISDLVLRGKIHLDPTTLRPFTGWVYGVYSEQGTPAMPAVPLLALRGRLEHGKPVGAFEFFDPEGRLIWEESRYSRGSACGSWTLAAQTEGGRVSEPGEGFEDRWFSWVAPGLAPDSSAGDDTTYPPCPVVPINPMTGQPVGSLRQEDPPAIDPIAPRLIPHPTPPWDATR